MPVMDGLTALRRIMSTQPTPVLMFSSLTHEGAQATLDALEAGAMDFLPKKFEDISRDRDEAKRVLCQRVRTLGLRGLRRSTPPPRPSPVPRPSHAVDSRPAAAPPAAPGKTSVRLTDFRVVLIGTSTGGPVALQQVLTRLPADFPLPILLIQHMPATFTPAFAQRLDQLCAIRVKEAADGDEVIPGTALLAPGGRQMVIEQRAGRVKVRVTDSDPGQHYRPCVDVTFSSAAKVFSGKALAIVLTGMGADGREGARLLKQGGATIWAQDEDSSVVYGMPAAVAEAGLADKILPLTKIGPSLAG
jgi:two-component system chemotaxis response regulator CheB